jgi:hypothetical protein
VGVDGAEGGAHHERVGFADVVRLDAGGAGDHGGNGAGGGDGTFGRRAGVVGVGGDEAGAVADEADCLGDALEAVCTGLAEDDVVGGVIGLGVAGFVEGLGETGFADDEGGAARALVGEEAGGGEGGGPDIGVGDVEADALEAGGEIARGVAGVVGEYEEGFAGDAEAGDEGVGAEDEVVLADDDAIHVHEVAVDGLGVGGHG